MRSGLPAARRAAAVLLVLAAAPALAQGTALPKQDGAPATVVEPAPEPVAPPPPEIAIPGVDTPAPAAELAADTPAPPPPPPTGAEYVPSAPIRVAPHIARGGGYFGLGLGFGTADYAPKSFASSGQASFSLRAGKIISDQLLIGPEAVFAAQFDRWAENTVVGTGLSSLLMEVMVFPVIDQPFNMAAGLGWGSGLAVSRLSKVSDGAPVIAEGHDGVSWMAALGWDFFAGRGWNLGLQARYDGVRFLGNGASGTRGFSLQIWLNSY